MTEQHAARPLFRIQPVSIRPHHILCTRAFRGKGYSTLFVEKMHAIISRIRKERKLNITAGCDAVCAACPHQRTQSKTVCVKEQKVQTIDKNVIHFLGIRHRLYDYAEIDRIITEKLTEQVFDAICGTCEWKRKNICTYSDVMNTL